MEGRRGAGVRVAAAGGEPRTVPATDFKLQKKKKKENLGPHLFTKKGE